VIRFLLSDNLRPLAGEAFSASTEEVPASTRLELLLVIQAALGDSRIVGELYPWTKKDR
jgi:hypothetical protein